MSKEFDRNITEQTDGDILSPEEIRTIIQERIKPEWKNGIPCTEAIIDSPLESVAISIIK